MVKKKGGRVKRNVVKKSVSKIRSEKLRNKTLWFIVTVFFLLSTLAVLTSIKEESLTGRATIQPLSFILAGQDVQLAVKDISGVDRIVIGVKDTIKNGKVVVSEDNGIEFDNKFFSKFTVVSAEADKMGPLNFELKIKESEMFEKGISLYDLKLHVNEKELQTNYVKSEKGYLYFTATSPEFGEFVIGRRGVLEVVEIKGVESLPVTEEVPVAVEEEPAVVEEITTEDSTLVGQAVSTGKEEVGFFRKIANFFKGLFN